MSQLTLTANDGTQHAGTLPESWEDTPLLPYCRLVAAETLTQRIEALAALVGLPAEPLLDQVDLYADLVRAAPWLLTQLPPAGEPVTEFTHLGQRYVSAGHLRTLSAGQLEAIYTMQQVHGEKPLEAAPGILAVLYVPQGQRLTQELHQASTKAFESLPLSVAWPALQDFIASGASAALPIATYSALAPQVEAALGELEQTLQTSSASSRFWQKPLRWALRRWIASARATATTPSK